MRAAVIVMDSFGIGSTPDAARFKDDGADTLGHIAAARAAQARPLFLPNLETLGLGLAYKRIHGAVPVGFSESPRCISSYGAAAAISSGKDTLSGHWELAGVPVTFDWGYFTSLTETFPPEFLDALQRRCSLPGYLGNCRASGTEIIARLGEEHVRTGKPIVYTSADSVFQVACHEETFGLQRLYDLCQTAFDALRPWNISRVIARPFTGATSGSFVRTANRHDYAVPPPAPTVMKKLVDAGGTVTAIGKIADIYANSGVSRHIKASGMDQLWEQTLNATAEAKDFSLTMSNFVDFDQTWGHRRDTFGYADALEAFDRRIPELLALLRQTDLIILTADHGCDPTWDGTDHTREYVPVLVYGPKISIGSIGIRPTFADIGQSLAEWFRLERFTTGESFL